jgi:hypothetical protein
MIHNTYRRLDESALQLGPLTLIQWLLICLLAGLMFGLKQLTGMPTQPLLCLATVVLGAPFFAMALSEGGRPSYLRMFRDAVRWAVRPKLYTTGGGTPRPFTIKADPQPRQPRESRSSRRRREATAAASTEEWSA